MAVNALAGAGPAELSPSEAAAVAELALPVLFAAWGGADGSRRRPPSADLLLTRLGLSAQDPTVVAACADSAVVVLAAGPAGTAAALGQAAVALLERCDIAVPLRLLLRTAEATVTAGQGEAADAVLERAAESTDDATAPGEAAAVALAHGRRLVTRGELERAQHLFERAAADFGLAGDESGVASARHEMADVYYGRGDLDEALRIRREEQLPVFERLGDVRSRAVTWGKIADVYYDRGDLDAAVELQERRLETNRGLGDIDGVAAALWGLAQIDLARTDFEAARPRVAEAYALFDRLGRTDGIAVVGSAHGQFLIANGEVDKGVAVLERAGQALRRLAQDASALEISKLFDSIRRGRDKEDDHTLPLLGWIYSRLAQPQPGAGGTARAGQPHGPPSRCGTRRPRPRWRRRQRARRNGCRKAHPLPRVAAASAGSTTPTASNRASWNERQLALGRRSDHRHPPRKERTKRRMSRRTCQSLLATTSTGWNWCWPGSPWWGSVRGGRRRAPLSAPRPPRRRVTRVTGRRAGHQP